MNENNYASNDGPTIAGVISLDRWTEQVGISPTCAWRWRKRGWLKTFNICGRQYVTADSIRDFRQRMERGEFAKELKPPRKRSANHRDSTSEGRTDS